MEEPIVTERLRMRPFVPEDVEPLHAIWADPAVGPWVGGTHTDIAESIEELGEHLRHQELHGYGFWAVEDRTSGALIGEVGLMRFEGRGPEVEIGWCMDREWWGLGLATEAATAWVTVGAARLGLDRIIAVVLPENTRSRAVCRALGMREAGRRHAYGADHVLYELDVTAPTAAG